VFVAVGVGDMLDTPPDVPDVAETSEPMLPACWLETDCIEASAVVEEP